MTPPDPNVPPPDGPPEPGPPPWINPEIQQRIKWRDGDVVISVPIKSGTTWTMNIVHQLRQGGDADLEDVYDEVPWIEFIPGPTTTVEDVVARIDDMPGDRRRAMKSHAAPPMLPFNKQGEGPDTKYVVVGRNPDEALVSMFPFIANHADEWFDLWQVPRQALVKPDFETFFNEVANPAFAGMIMGFVAGWWPLRNEPNVLMMHFGDMKKDHEGSVRKIANFLGLDPTAQQWPKILEYTSFNWMKAHQEKFEGTTLSPTPVLKSGAMIRKGRVGAANEDGMTDAISAQIAGMAKEIVRDPAAIEWLYSGGNV